jgi:hypothetical protein
MAAVLADTLFDACGARAFQFPMIPKRVKKTMALGIRNDQPP